MLMSYQYNGIPVFILVLVFDSVKQSPPEIGTSFDTARNSPMRQFPSHTCAADSLSMHLRRSQRSGEDNDFHDARAEIEKTKDPGAKRIDKLVSVRRPRASSSTRRWRPFYLDGGL